MAIRIDETEDKVLRRFRERRETLLQIRQGLQTRKAQFEDDERKFQVAAEEFQRVYGVSIDGEILSVSELRSARSGSEGVGVDKLKPPFFYKLVVEIGTGLVKEKGSFSADQVFDVIRHEHAELYPDANCKSIEAMLQGMSEFAYSGKGSSLSGNLANHYVLTPQKPSPPPSPVEGGQYRGRRGRPSLWGRRNDALVTEVMEKLQRPLAPRELARELRQLGVKEKDLQGRTLYNNLVRLAKSGTILRDPKNRRISLPSKQVA